MQRSQPSSSVSSTGADGVINKRIQPAVLFLQIGKNPFNVGTIANVRQRRACIRIYGEELVDVVHRRIADMNRIALGNATFRNGSAYPRCAA
jgi:hypothetical protein